MAVEWQFGKKLGELWVRDGIAPSDPHALAADVAARFARGGEDARAAAAMLEDSGVRAAWNRVLRDDRSRSLASRIRPLIAGPMLDVLSGDGSICRALADLGATDLSATERQDDYSALAWQMPQGVRFAPFCDTLDLATFGARTALVSTVLHHEADPVPLLDAVARSGAARWIVVENCVTPDFPLAFHEFADRFFNTCLNDIGVPCGDQHRTLEEWTTLLGRYGHVTTVEDFFDVPGIPFPYTLFVLDRPALNGR